MPEPERPRRDHRRDQGVPLTSQPEPTPAGPLAGDELSLEDFYEHAPCGYLTLLADGTVARVNQTFLDWTGQDRASLLAGTRFVSLLTIGGQIFFETHCMPLLLAGQPVDQLALDVRRADGTPLPVLFAAKVHATGPEGGPELVRVTIVDVSHRRLFEQQLVARNDELANSNVHYDAFAHAVAHDLQAPLRGIRMNAEFVLDDSAGQLPGDGEELLRKVVRLSERMKEMLDDLLTYAQAGQDGWHPQPTSLQATVAKVVELLGGRVGGAAITTEEATLTADPGALRQVLLNLVSNAVKYSTGPAELAIGTCSLAEAASRSALPPVLTGVPADTLVITVADGGIGIDPIHHERIFDLFRQLDADADGSGAGLALCRLICRRHGGDIWLTSTPGKGSTFFVLPGR